MPISIALGLFYLKCFVLRPPIKRRRKESLLQFIERVTQGDRRTITDYWPEAPQALIRICEQCLQTEAEDRYSDCDVLRSELTHVLGDLSASVSELERKRLAARQQASWMRLQVWQVWKTESGVICAGTISHWF